MSRNVPLRGIVAYPITPIDSNDHVNLAKLKLLVDRLLDSGVHGIAPLGSAGILPYLSDREREAVADTVVSHVAGRVPTLVGVSALTTERVVHHARYAERVGASAVMIIPTSYWKLTEDEVFSHFATVADSISIPVMAYNNPATGGLDLTPRFLARLLTIPNVTMVKESTGDVNRLHRLLQEAGSEVAFFNGSNPLALDAFVAGARGWCTAAPLLIPELTLKLFAAYERQDLAAARSIFHHQLPLLQFIVQGGLPRTISAGLELMGLDVGSLRSPLQPLPSSGIKELKSILTDLGEIHMMQ